MIVITFLMIIGFAYLLNVLYHKITETKIGRVILYSIVAFIFVLTIYKGYTMSDEEKARLSQPAECTAPEENPFLNLSLIHI